jgi:phosphoglycolate phosphatase-like HAD superfamily hydrolase
MIGDHPAEVEFVLNIGAKGIHLLTGHGKKHQKEIKNMPYYKQIKVFQNLKSAMKNILD